MHSEYVERLVNLDAAGGGTRSRDDAGRSGRAGPVRRSDQVREIDGHFAIVTKDGKKVRMARSLGRPMRYFLAKRSEGRRLVVAERIDEIYRILRVRRTRRPVPPLTPGWSRPTISWTPS